jgi:hypothetical protein
METVAGIEKRVLRGGKGVINVGQQPEGIDEESNYE